MYSTLNKVFDKAKTSFEMVEPKLLFNTSDTTIHFNGQHYVFANFRNNLATSNSHNRLVDIRSNQKKILLSANIGMYNFFYTTIPTILRLSELFNDAVIYLDVSVTKLESNNRGFVDFMRTVLDGEDIDYQIVDPETTDGLIVNNFVTLFAGDVDVYASHIAKASRLYKKYANVEQVEPYRRVYLSRRNIMPRDMHHLPDGLSTKVDHRLLDESVLENFFSKAGFEIVCPEDDFDSMASQIKYFNSVKTLASITSSGISNSMFMQPGGTILEIQTPFIGESDSPGTGQESLHLLYGPMSYILNNIYVSIPNNDKLSKTIIETITSTDASKILGINVKEDN
jgi:hypothetical protein